MSIAIFDMAVSAICILGGIIVAAVNLKLFCDKRTPLIPVFVISTGIVAWSTYFTLALATVVSIGIDPDWAVKSNYAVARAFMSVPWFYLLYNIRLGAIR